MDDNLYLYVFNDNLSPGDIVQDGENGGKIEIIQKSRLVWIDLDKEAKFTHPTIYIFVAEAKTIDPETGIDESVKIMPGNERPYLNGKMILPLNEPPIAISKNCE